MRSACHTKLVGEGGNIFHVQEMNEDIFSSIGALEMGSWSFLFLLFLDFAFMCDLAF